MKTLLVIAPTFRAAERYMANRILPADTDWHWVVDAHRARLWLIRAERRGVDLDATLVTVDESAYADRRAA